MVRNGSLNHVLENAHDANDGWMEEDKGNPSLLAKQKRLLHLDKLQRGKQVEHTYDQSA
jgi:hypothetical protein